MRTTATVTARGTICILAVILTAASVGLGTGCRTRPPARIQTQGPRVFGNPAPMAGPPPTGVIVVQAPAPAVPVPPPAPAPQPPPPPPVVVTTVPAAAVSAVATASVPAVAGQAPILSREYRYAARHDEWFERGDAAITGSPIFAQGIRLAAWDSRDDQELSRMAIATAVYFLQVPASTQSLNIEVGYQNVNLADGGLAVAGFLFVRDRSVERQYAEAAAKSPGPLDEPGFFGATYLLPRDQTKMVVDLPAADHVVDGIMELHLSTGAGQAIDVQYVQLTALAPPPTPTVLVTYPAPASVTVVDASPEYACYDASVYTYGYYYAGPWHSHHRHYPHSWVRMSVYWHDDWDWDFLFVDGWLSFRACFYTWHPRHCRPHGYEHYDRPVPREIVAGPGPRLDHPGVKDYKSRWVDRHYGVKPELQAGADLDNLARRRKVSLDRNKMDEFDRSTRQVSAAVQQTGRDLKLDRRGQPAGGGAPQKPTGAAMAESRARIAKADDGLRGFARPAPVAAAARPTAAPSTATVGKPGAPGAGPAATPDTTRRSDRVTTVPPPRRDPVVVTTPPTVPAAATKPGPDVRRGRGPAQTGDSGAQRPAPTPGKPQGAVARPDTAPSTTRGTGPGADPARTKPEARTAPVDMAPPIPAPAATGPDAPTTVTTPAVRTGTRSPDLRRKIEDARQRDYAPAAAAPVIQTQPTVTAPAAVDTAPARRFERTPTPAPTFEVRTAPADTGVKASPGADASPSRVYRSAPVTPTVEPSRATPATPAARAKAGRGADGILGTADDGDGGGLPGGSGKRR